MCIAIYQPLGVDRPTDDRLQECFANNPDGAGFAYAYKDRIRIYKGYFSYSEFAAMYDKAFERMGTDAAYVLHFRIATAGVINKANCHPFRVSPDMVAAHNGCIDGYPAASRKSPASDTSHFVRDVLKRIPNNWQDYDGIWSLLSYRLIGSKVIVLRADGSAQIINEEDGIWETDGCWYSNTTFRPSRWQKWVADYERDKPSHTKLLTNQRTFPEADTALYYDWQCDDCDCYLTDDDLEMGRCLDCGAWINYANMPNDPQLILCKKGGDSD